MALEESSRRLLVSSLLTCCLSAWEWPRGTHENKSSHLLVVYPGDHGHVRSDLSARRHRLVTTVVSRQGQRTTDRKKRQARWIPDYRTSFHRPRLLPFTPVSSGNGKRLRSDFQRRVQSGAHEQSLGRPRQW